MIRFDLAKNPRKAVTGQARKTMEKLIKENRLVFVDDKTLDYTNQQGEKQRISYYDMADIFVSKTIGATFGGFDGSIIGVTHQDFVKELDDLYKKGGN